MGKRIQSREMIEDATFAIRKKRSEVVGRNLPIGGDGGLNPVLGKHRQPHDIIHFTFDDLAARTEDFKRLYRKGLSLSEIAHRSHVAKATVLKTLREAGVDLRPKNSVPGHQAWRKSGRPAMKPPYGFCYLDGALTKHPKEYSHLVAIIERLKRNQSYCSIAKWLNGKHIPSPLGKLWSDNSVKAISLRLKNKKLVKRGDQYELR